MMEFPDRKAIRMANYDYSTPGAYFITVCTANREKIFREIVGSDIIRPQNIPLSAPTVPTVVGSMKRWVSRQIGRPIWQKSFYEHAVRNRRDYEEIWEYIENNPLKHALKKAP